MAYLDEMDRKFGLVDGQSIVDKGKELSQAYNRANPFPHIVIDDFLPPELLDRCLDDFPTQVDAAERSYNREQERFKASFNPDRLSPALRILFYSFNSRPFIRFMENLTGIEGLIPDPLFVGAGLHQISQGGHLSVHADFNHHKQLNLERRINALIYLNKDWRPEYGGQLELWDEDMKHCATTVVPEFNRCVVFNTTSLSHHGNPNPINHPNGTPRRSIALYYYTATWDDSRREHTTQFRVRPGSEDKRDWHVRLRELAVDLTPPLLLRKIRLITRKV